MDELILGTCFETVFEKFNLNQTMNTPDKETSLRKLVLLAAIAGMRSMIAPALLSLNLKEEEKRDLTQEGIGFVGNPSTAKALSALATVELLGDKLPFTPSRLTKPQFSFRTLTGASMGALTFRLGGLDPVRGAVVGSIVTIASTVLSYTVRKGLAKSRILPEPLTGIVEDMLVFYLAGKYLKASNEVIVSSSEALLVELDLV